ncbi:MAG: ABC transporter permease [Oscillospiraceae bacterium]|jgi:simple sugar transport system permease protein|nr:ABC transporter permease [Oscillospiraceae bacterium]
MANTLLNQIVNIINAAVLAGVPLLLGTTGEIITEKSGHLNLGVEGLMYIGAAFGFAAGYYTNSEALALICAFLGGVLGSVLYAFLTVTLRANQNVTGLTLTVFGAGFANYIGDALINSTASKAVSLSAEVKAAFNPVSIPGLSALPIAGKLLFQYNMFVYLAVAIAILTGLYLNRTRTGLNLRAIGENAAAADAMGVRVTQYKYINIMLGGGICALGGAYIAIVTCGGTWIYNCVSGQGWIAVALVIFAGWSPYRALMGSLVFGGLSVIRFYLPGGYVPPAMLSMLPFVVTCVVLVVTSVRSARGGNQPAACGVNYYREER